MTSVSGISGRARSGIRPPGLQGGLLALLSVVLKMKVRQVTFGACEDMLGLAQRCHFSRCGLGLTLHF